MESFANLGFDRRDRGVATIVAAALSAFEFLVPFPRIGAGGPGWGFSACACFSGLL